MLSSGLSEEEIAKILAQRRTDRVQTAKAPGAAPAAARPRRAPEREARRSAAPAAAPAPRRRRVPSRAARRLAPAPADDDLEVLPDDDDLEAVLEEVTGAAEDGGRAAGPARAGRAAARRSEGRRCRAARPRSRRPPPRGPPPRAPRPRSHRPRAPPVAARAARRPPRPSPRPRTCSPLPTTAWSAPRTSCVGPLDVVADDGGDARPRGARRPRPSSTARCPAGENEIELDPGDLEGLGDVDLGSAGDFSTGVDGGPMIGGAAEFSEGDFAAPAAEEDPNAKTQPDLEGESAGRRGAGPPRARPTLFGEAGVDLSLFGDDGEEGR